MKKYLAILTIACLMGCKKKIGDQWYYRPASTDRPICGDFRLSQDNNGNPQVTIYREHQKDSLTFYSGHWHPIVSEPDNSCIERTSEQQK
jgi:hypothetical protein